MKIENLEKAMALAENIKTVNNLSAPRAIRSMHIIAEDVHGDEYTFNCTEDIINLSLQIEKSRLLKEYYKLDRQ